MLILAGGVLFLGFSGTLPLRWEQQLLFAALTVIAAFLMNRSSKFYLGTLTLMLLSAYSTFRYGFWRLSTVLAYFRDPGNKWTRLDALFIGLLFLAECYAFMVLVLGYIQVLWPLQRSPVPLPDDPRDWPAVDLLIPTANEPLTVVRFTALAAMNIDWPPEKLHVYILDDGQREEFRTFAEQAGIGYMSRDDNVHAKAGNINHALSQLDSPFVAIFDCDHVPTRSFLQVTMGWLLRDQKLAMLQTPHHLYSPDPFERNLDQFRSIPNENELFYGVVQDGNDFWNAACFCGSCAVLRRSALDQVGGMAVETVTEDAHTSLRLQKRGWNTAYINIPQAAGLATERLSAHVNQRIRWARGMVQTLRVENPLFARGLKAGQRLCYFNAMSHFLFALPRLIFLTAPLIYLVFGMTSIPGFWAAIVAYAIPHLVLSNLAHSRIQGQHRYSFWHEIYETVLAPYILFPTLLALINPKLGKFNITPKGGVVDKDHFDARIARPFLLLLLLNFFGLLCAVARAWRFPTFVVSSWFSFVNWPAHIYDGRHMGTIAVNTAWVLFNLVILGVATAVARESQQRRQTTRVEMEVPSDVILPDGTMIQGVTSDLSGGGVRTTVEGAVTVKVGDSLEFVFPMLNGTATLPAILVAIQGNELRAQFSSLSLQQDEALTILLYSRADTWLPRGVARHADNPLRSLLHILRLSIRGLAMTVGARRGGKITPNARLAASIVTIILLAAIAGVVPRVVRGAQSAGPLVMMPVASSSAAPTAANSLARGNFDTSFKLIDVGATNPIILRGVDSSYSVYFSVPRTQVAKSATMKLRYRFSPGLLPGLSHLNVSLNGSLFATLAVSPPANSGQQPGPLEAALTLPAELLMHDNAIRFEFIGHYARQCEDPTSSTLWTQIDSNSTVELSGSQIALANDLNSLPLPFYDSGVNLHPPVPIVFLSQPSPKAMQAAAIVASWLGTLNESHPLRFTVSIGTIPEGNPIVFAERSSQIPAALQQGVAIAGATVAMRTNPSDPNYSVLLVSGDNADELLKAASALVLHGNTWQGAQVSILNLTLPPPLRVDDAPRWLSTDRVRTFGQMAQISPRLGDPKEEMEGDGSVPLNLYFRLPPDLNFGDRQNLPFDLSYRYNGVPLAKGSTLQVYVNGAFVSATPMPHTDKASAVLETVVPIPVVDLRPFSNTISLKFMFQIAKPGNCENTAPPNLQGSILKDSYLDITGISHAAVLPDLELFANAGYPFTRKADLSDTSVVLPQHPSARELEMFLAMMGHFGAQTGYPVLDVRVTDSAGMTRDGIDNYLIMGTVDDQPAFKALSAALPVAVDKNGLRIHDTRGLLDRSTGWPAGSTGLTQVGQLATGGELPDALVEEFQWPADSNRSALVILLRDDNAIPNFLSTFLKGSHSSDIAQSISVLHNGQFSSYRLGNGVYTVGESSAFTPVTKILQAFPWLIAMVTVMCCFLMAVLLQARLRRRARLRLQAAE